MISELDSQDKKLIHKLNRKEQFPATMQGFTSGYFVAIIQLMHFADK